jgi:hypothetical protein
MLRADLKLKALQLLKDLTPVNYKERELITALYKSVYEDDAEHVDLIAREVFSGDVDLNNPIMPTIDWVCSIVCSWHETYGEQ